MGAGLSSSSALVVATAEAVRVFNRLPVSARRLVSLCGEGEWFRRHPRRGGGPCGHPALASRCVTRVGFFPFQIEDSARFFRGTTWWPATRAFTPANLAKPAILSMRR